MLKKPFTNNNHNPHAHVNEHEGYRGVGMTNNLNNQDNQQDLSIEQQNRRLFMGKMVGLFGLTTATAVLAGCSVPMAMQYKNRSGLPDRPLFSEQEMTTLADIGATILPRTDTPSATELDCHGFVQHQLVHCHKPAQQQQSIDIINKIDEHSEKHFAKPFSLLSPLQQQQLLIDLEQQTNFSVQDSQGFAFLKALIVFGYFTSEVGATQALNYQAVPGDFVGSIPIDENTKGAGSQAYY
jgi:hypothetical protein